MRERFCRTPSVYRQSEKAFGCCVYLVASEGSTLLYSKAKGVPLKVQTLAHLDLQVAYLGSLVLSFVYEELRFKYLLFTHGQIARMFSIGFKDQFIITSTIYYMDM